MQTNKQLIYNYLKGKFWTNKALILTDVVELSERPVYHSSIDRCLRTMVREGTLVKKKEGKGSAYAIRTDDVQRSSDLIIRQQLRIQKERAELDNRPQAML